MTTLERIRRPVRAPQRTVWLHCMRCTREFVSESIDRECVLCNHAAVKAFGSPHPLMELGGM